MKADPTGLVEDCRVYWKPLCRASGRTRPHTCALPRGHDDYCVCQCALDGGAQADNGRPPYFGHATKFYGEDYRPKPLRPWIPTYDV